MKYWSLLAVKLAAVAGLSYGLWMLVLSLMPKPAYVLTRENTAPFGTDLGWTSVILLLFLVTVGLFAIAIIDQRYRCRTCARRLRMPVETGSWPNSFLIGPPKMEYICSFGHGTLNVPELQIGGREQSSWKQHGDIWQELFSKK